MTAAAIVILKTRVLPLWIGLLAASWTERTPKILLPVLDHAVFGAAWGLANWAVGGRERRD